MSAMLVHDKYAPEVHEDEFSTSAGSSDSEVNATSGDDEPASGFECDAATPCAPSPKQSPQKPFQAEIVHLVLVAVAAATALALDVAMAKPASMTTVALSIFLALICMLLFATPSTNKQTTSIAKFDAGTGCAQQEKIQKAGGRRITKNPKLLRQQQLGSTIGFPPGITLQDDGTAKPLETQQQFDSVISPPPGLVLQEDGCDVPPSACREDLLLEEVGPPPGLEGLSRPPGIFFESEHLAAAKPAKNKKGLKQPLAVPTAERQPNRPTLVQAAPQATEAMLLKQWAKAIPRDFNQAIYRKELSDVLRDVANGSCNVAVAVRRIRIQNVPKEKEAAEFADILTRAAEETRGEARRLSFAFAVGLTAGERDQAFSREECERGIEYFFLEVFEDLAAEVPRLRSKLANELTPLLRTVFTEEQMARIVPPDCRPAAVLCTKASIK